MKVKYSKVQVNEVQVSLNIVNIKQLYFKMQKLVSNHDFLHLYVIFTSNIEPTIEWEIDGSLHESLQPNLLQNMKWYGSILS